MREVAVGVAPPKLSSAKLLESLVQLELNLNSLVALLLTVHVPPAVNVSSLPGILEVLLSMPYSPLKKLLEGA
jgi:hypothetical protein